MRRLLLALVAVFGVATPTAGGAKWRPLPCPFNEFLGQRVCTWRLPSKSYSPIVFNDNCGAPRRFAAWDRSKRVSYYAEGHWIAPGVVRMRDYGAPLGPIWVVARIKSAKRLTLRNRSAFPVTIRWVVTCQYGD